MKIGIDIDNTICNTSYLSEKIYNKKYGKDFKLLNKKEQYNFTALYEREIFDNVVLEKDAKKVINKLYDMGNEIYFITARSNNFVKDIERRTIDYLDKNKIKYHDIYFGCNEKLDVYKKLKLDIMLDDDYDVYKLITDNGFRAIMYAGILNIGKQGYRVNNLNEFMTYIERISNGK